MCLRHSFPSLLKTQIGSRSAASDPNQSGNANRALHWCKCVPYVIHMRVAEAIVVSLCGRTAVRMSEELRQT